MPTLGQHTYEELTTQPEAWESALFMPPFGSRRSIRTGNAWERVGHRLWPRLAGVHIVLASKSMYLPAPVEGKRRRVLSPALAGSRSQADMPEHAQAFSAEVDAGSAQKTRQPK